MRVTCVLHHQHIGNQFIFHWLLQGRRKVLQDGTKAALNSKGIDTIDMKEVITPPFMTQEERLKMPRPPSLQQSFAPPCPVTRDEPCHVFTQHFSPIMGLRQAQLITNTLARPALPRPITDHVSAISADSEMDEKVKDAILHSHLLDTHQERLPKIHDVINNPGWNFPREYGIPLRRKNKSLTYQLLLLLDQVEGCGLERQLLEDAYTQLILPHGNRLMQMRHCAGFLVSSPTPLPPLAGTEEVQQVALTEEMPDLYPLSPFNNCRPHDKYPIEEFYAVESAHLHPHTIFMHHNQPRMAHTEDVFMGMSLLYAFSHAAAYAKLVKKLPTGDLEEPITVQVVHSNCRHYHVGVLQLNTLNLAPSSQAATRNLFWTQGWDTLFDLCQFKAGKPVLQGYNPKIFSLLRGLHAQG